MSGCCSRRRDEADIVATSTEADMVFAGIAGRSAGFRIAEASLTVKRLLHQLFSGLGTLLCGLALFEILFYCCCGVLILIVGPFVWMTKLALASSFAGLMAVIVAWGVSVGIVASDVRYRRWSVISLGVCVVWLVTLLGMFVYHMES